MAEVRWEIQIVAIGGQNRLTFPDSSHRVFVEFPIPNLVGGLEHVAGRVDVIEYRPQLIGYGSEGCNVFTLGQRNADQVGRGNPHQALSFGYGLRRFGCLISFHRFIVVRVGMPHLLRSHG